MALKNQKEVDHALTALEEDILNVLIGREKYGLEICEGFELATSGRRRLSIGSLYPTLYKLENKGWVKSHWGTETHEERGGARRKYYKITGAGQRRLHKQERERGSLKAWQPAQ